MKELFCLEKEVFTFLINDKNLNKIIKGIHTYVPDNVDYPFVKVGKLSKRNMFLSMSNIVNAVLQIEVFFDNPSNKECLKLKGLTLLNINLENHFIPSFNIEQRFQMLHSKPEKHSVSINFKGIYVTTEAVIALEKLAFSQQINGYEIKLNDSINISGDFYISEYNLENIIKRLIKGDFSQKQAEAIAVEFKNIRDEFSTNIISQQFFDTNMKYYAKRLESKITSSKSEMLKWFIGASLTQSSLLVVFIIGILDFLLKKM